MMQILST